MQTSFSNASKVNELKSFSSNRFLFEFKFWSCPQTMTKDPFQTCTALWIHTRVTRSAQCLSGTHTGIKLYWNKIKDSEFSESLFIIRNRHRIWPRTDLLTPAQTEKYPNNKNMHSLTHDWQQWQKDCIFLCLCLNDFDYRRTYKIKNIYIFLFNWLKFYHLNEQPTTKTFFICIFILFSNKNLNSLKTKVFKL